jgi:intracellular septation protein A
MSHWPVARDALLFFGGLTGVIHETVFTSLERPALLILFAAMMGLPAFLRTDETRRRNE